MCKTLKSPTFVFFFTDSQGRYSEVIKKSNAIELLFTLYPPQGAKVNISTRLRSTWLRPIVDGEEGYKYIGKMLALSSKEKKKCCLMFCNMLFASWVSCVCSGLSVCILCFCALIHTVETQCAKLFLDDERLGCFHCGFLK